MEQLFAVLFFAASPRLFKTPIEAVQQRFGLSRRNAIMIVELVAVGILIENGDIVGS